MAVEKTSGAPSTGSTSPGFCKQNTCSALGFRSGGNCAASTAGNPTTITDFGLRNDGGLFKCKFNCSVFGIARAGMY